MKRKAGAVYHRYISSVEKLIAEIDHSTVYQKLNGGLIQCAYCGHLDNVMYRNSAYKYECSTCRDSLLAGQFSVNENGRFWSFS